MKVLLAPLRFTVALLLGCLLLAPMARGAVTILQSSGATAVAWEAEKYGTYLDDPFTAPAPPRVFWTPTNDAAASGGAVLYVLSPTGANITSNAISYVDYRLQFTTPGTYRLYTRWKADAVWASGDRFTANSYWTPLTFNAPTAPDNPSTLAAYVASASNGSDAQGTPSSTNFTVIGETTSFAVTQTMVDSLEVVTLRLGTRERGMIIDRIVMSTDPALSEAGFNALPNTGLDNKPPAIASVSSSLNFTNVTITFDEPIAPGSLDVFNFQANNGLLLLGLNLDSATLRKLTIHTSQQTPGTTYTITFSGVEDVSGNTVPPASQAVFESWRIQTGWVTREIYNGIAGATVADLTSSPKYPDNADAVESFTSVTMENSPRGNNYGMRIRCFFVPPATDTYDFYVYADDQAEVFISTDESPANLQSLVLTTAASSSYDPNVKGGLPFDTLTAGQRYLLQVLFKQGSADARLGVAAARKNTGGFAPAGLPPLIELSGSAVSTYINPASASVTITKQPQNTNVTVGNNASFEVAATSPAGAVALQWQLNDVDIPGATRSVYTTPALSFADAGKRYRARAIAGGAVATSAEAVVGVNAGQPPTAQPYIGINFLGGGGAVEGYLSASDIAGAVPQANFNNIEGGAQTAAPLRDASGAATPATLTYTASIRYTGAGNITAENALFEGYIQNNNTPMSVTLSGVPPGSYGLLAYSVGFDFQTIYDQAYELVGAVTYPVFHVRAQTAGQYRASPGYRRMFSTDPNARDSGNYVMFENISPDGSGNFTLNLTPEPPATPGVTDAMPALNGMQLVRLVAPLPALTIVRNPNGSASVAWGADAAGYTLESTGSLGTTPAPNWQPASGAPNPIVGAGSVNVPGPGNLFLRLRQ
jgi:hypothetical protein